MHDLFRAVHTMKGGARLLKIRKMETLTHQLESLLDQVRNGWTQASLTIERWKGRWNYDVQRLVEGCAYEAEGLI